MEEKFVYVIFDPLNEEVACVHDEPGVECDDCDFLNEERNQIRGYYLTETKHIVKSKKEL